MFVGFSKTIARVGGFRLGVGIRMNKNNAVWVMFLLMFVVMFQMVWYMLLLCGWMIYAIIYAMCYGIKKIVALCSHH